MSPPLVSPNLLARHIAWLSVGEFLSRLIAFIVAINLARQLGAENYGALGVALALVSYLVVVVDGGLEPVAVREIARNPAGLPALLKRIIGQRLLAASLMYVLLLALVFLLPDRALGGRVLALIFGGRLFAYALKTDWALRGREQMRGVALGLLAQHVVYGLGIIAVLRSSAIPLFFVPVVHVGAELVLALFYALWLRALPRAAPVVPPPDPPNVLRESLPIGLAKVLRVAYYEGDLLLLGWLAAAPQAGYFLASQRIVLSLVALVVLYQQSAFPTLSRLAQVNLAESRSFQNDVSRYALLWSVPIAAGGIYLSLPVMVLLFGPEYRDSAPILAILLLSLPVVLLQMGWHNQMLASGHAAPYLITVAAGTATHIGLGLIWIPGGGGVGAAWSTLLGECVTCGMAAGYAAFTHKASPVTARVLAIAAAGIAMVIAMSFLQHLHFVVSGLIGLVVYAVAALSLGGLRLQEARRALTLFGRIEPISK